MLAFQAMFKNLLIIKFFHNIFLYKEFLLQSVARDLKKKYKRSSLGYIWTILHPLMMMIVLSVVFSSIMNMPRNDYAVFLFSGLLPWNFFSSTTMMSLHSIRNNSNLFKQVPIPKYMFVVSIACSNMFNFLVSLIPLLLLTLFIKGTIYPTVLLAPLIILPIFILTLAFSILLSIFNVFFDDTQHLSEVGLQILYFLTPILYGKEILIEKAPHLAEWLVLNPLYKPIEIFRDLFLNGTLPTITSILGVYLFSLIILYIGLKISKKYDDIILYYL